MNQRTAPSAMGGVLLCGTSAVFYRDFRRMNSIVSEDPARPSGYTLALIASLAVPKSTAFRTAGFAG